MKIRLFTTVWMLSLSSLSLLAQSTTESYQRYVAQWREVALQDEQEFGIPASITLAQGLLESAAGSSELARKANNHFGIKCSSDWKGNTYAYDDDARGECFRMYDDAAQSFADHSRFLQRDRYKSCFEIPLDDYSGWARALRRCGYATDPAYAQKLIRIIEEYRLDTIGKTTTVVEEPVVEEPVVEEPIVEEPVVAPVVIAPVIVEPVVEEPVVEAPVVAPVVEEPVVEAPVVAPVVVAPVVEVEPAASEAEPNPKDDVNVNVNVNENVNANANNNGVVVVERGDIIAVITRDPDPEYREPLSAREERRRFWKSHTQKSERGLSYAVAEVGDTYANVAFRLNMRERQLREFNDALGDRELAPGDRIYLHKKFKYAPRIKGLMWVHPGEQIWDIAQREAIQMNTIYTLNYWDRGLTTIRTRQAILLRKPKKEKNNKR